MAEIADYYVIRGETLEKIANAIRKKTGGTGKLTPAEMIGTIESIAGEGGLDTSAGTASEEHVLNGKIAYSQGVQVTGTIPDNGELSLTISGTMAESVSIPAGYTSGGTVSLTDDVETALAAI